MFHSKSSLTFCLTLLLGGALSFGNEAPQKDDSQRMEKTMARLTKELDLTSSQAAKIKDLFEAGMKEMRKGRPGDEMHEEMINQLRATTPDTAAMNKSFEAHLVKMRQQHALMMKNVAELHGMLTAEQRTKLAMFMEKRHDEMEKRMKEFRKEMMDRWRKTSADSSSEPW